MLLPIERGNDLDAPIDATLKTRAKALIIEKHDDQLESIHVVPVPSPGDSDSLIESLIAEGVDVAVFGYVSSFHYAELKHAGVTVYLLAEGSVRDALCALFEHSLHDQTGRDICEGCRDN